MSILQKTIKESTKLNLPISGGKGLKISDPIVIHVDTSKEAIRLEKFIIAFIGAMRGCDFTLHEQHLLVEDGKHIDQLDVVWGNDPDHIFSFYFDISQVFKDEGISDVEKIINGVKELFDVKLDISGGSGFSRDQAIVVKSFDMDEAKRVQTMILEYIADKLSTDYSYKKQKFHTQGNEVIRAVTINLSILEQDLDIYFNVTNSFNK